MASLFFDKATGVDRLAPKKDEKTQSPNEPKFSSGDTRLDAKKPKTPKPKIKLQKVTVFRGKGGSPSEFDIEADEIEYADGEIDNPTQDDEDEDSGRLFGNLDDNGNEDEDDQEATQINSAAQQFVDNLLEDYKQNKASRLKGDNTGELRWVSFNAPRHAEQFVKYQFGKMGEHLQNEWQKFIGLSKAEIAKGNENWFGSPMPTSIQELENLSKFRNMDKYLALKKEVAKRLKELKKIQNLEARPQKKIAFNDREIGIFNFDRAAIMLKKDKETGDIYSENKKSFAYFENIDKEVKSVRIYVTRPSSAASGDADNLLYKGILTAILTEELVQLGYEVEVIGINGTTDFNDFSYKNGLRYYATFTTFKKPNARFYLDEFLLMCADGAYLRYKAFKEQIAVYNHFKQINKRTQKYGSLTFDANVPYLITKVNDNSKFILIRYVYSEAVLLRVITTILNQIKEGIFLKKPFISDDNE